MFWRRKARFDDLKVHVDLPCIGEHGGAMYWEDDFGGIALHVFNMPPDCPPLDDGAILETYGRLAREAGQGLVECGRCSVAGVPSIRVVMKAVMDPETLRGRTYVGSITVPFRDFSLVLKAQYQESGMTGAREAVVFDKALAAGDVVVGEGGAEGWLRETDVPPHLARNLAEDPVWDDAFPDHPLTRVRRMLRDVCETAEMSTWMGRQAAFDG